MQEILRAGDILSTRIDEIAAVRQHDVGSIVNAVSNVKYSLQHDQE